MTESKHASLWQMVMNWVAARKWIVDMDGMRMTAKRAAVVVGRATARHRRMVWKAVVQREQAVRVAVAGVVSPQIRGRGVRCEVAVDIGDLDKVPA